MKKKILLIATGGTIASKHTESGLTPKHAPDELLKYVPETESFCQVDTLQLFSMDSTNMGPSQWLTLATTIEAKYEFYDGFVICHGTDTMAYTAAALSYLIQNNRRPIVITGAQKPIDLPITDARVNLRDSLRFASDSRAHGVNIVFGGKVIAGTRAKKEYSKSYNAFSSINYPEIAIIQDSRIVFFINDKDQIPKPLTFLETLLEKYDGVIVESFGVGGFPDNGDHSFMEAIKKGIEQDKIIVMATQVTHEGSDMGIYRVGKVIKETFDLTEAYDMTLEATVTKTMWALAQAKDEKEFKKLFYQTINHDMLFQNEEYSDNIIQ